MGMPYDTFFLTLLYSNYTEKLIEWDLAFHFSGHSTITLMVA